MPIARISVSFGSFKFFISNPLFWIGVSLILIVLLYKWGFKKFISFCIVNSILLFLMFKADNFIINFFGKEEGDFYTLLTKPLFVFFMGAVFLYYSFQKD